jgi:hypothetical protein
MYVRENRRRGASRGKHCRGERTTPSFRSRAGALVAFAGLTAASLLAPSEIPTPTAATPTRLLSTYYLAPTQFPVLFALRGQDLIDVERPWAADAYAKHTGNPLATLPEPDDVEVDYPARFLDASSASIGLENLTTASEGDAGPIVMVGYSQGARVIAAYKQQFNEQYQNGDPIPTFVFIGNTSRPNGGLYNRLASLGIPLSDAYNAPTETSGVGPGVITTYDYVYQYDGFADFPNRPLNPFSTVNALFGLLLSHAAYGPVDADNGLGGLIVHNNPYGTASPSGAVSQGRYGDTQYYLIPAQALPMLQPLAFIGVPKFVIAALDAPLRVLVEAGYDRTISPGQPTPAQLLPIADPVKTAFNFALAIPTGLDDALSDLGLGRPFGTTRATSPYGVGGPPVEVQSPPDNALTAKIAASAPAADPIANSTAPALTNDIAPLGIQTPVFRSAQLKGSTAVEPRKSLEVGSGDGSADATSNAADLRGARELVRNSLNFSPPTPSGSSTTTNDATNEAAVNEAASSEPNPVDAETASDASAAKSTDAAPN